MNRASSVVWRALLGLSLACGFVGCIDEQSSTPPGFEAGVIPGFEAGVIDTPDADRTAPDTTITVKPASLSNEATAKFEFTSTRPGRFGCRVDDGTPSECVSPLSIPVTDGPHEFEVSAVSQAGVPDETPARYQWTVDITPPDTTISKAPPSIDNSTTVSFEFTATEEVTFQCAVDGAAPADCVSPHVVSGLGDGAHSLSVIAKDAAGNLDPSPAIHAWTIDTSVPDTVIETGPTTLFSSTTATITFSSPNAGTGATYTCSLDGAAFTPCTSPITLTGLSQGSHTFLVKVSDAANTDPTPAERTWTVDTIAPTATVTGGPTGPTNDTTPTFTFTTAGGATKTECRVDAAAFVVCTSPFTAPALAQGSHTFEVRASDAANNASSATRAFSVDTTAPTVTITSGPAGPTNDTTPTFTFTTGGGATGTTCRVDAGAFVACTSPFTPAALANGSFTFEVRTADVAGNSASATRAFSVDTAPPVVTITTGPSGPTNDTTPSFGFTAVGATAVACRIPPAAFAACTSPFTPPALANGNYTVEVRGTDAANNSAIATRAFSVDTVAPTVAITSGPTGFTNVAAPSFAFTTSADVVTRSCRLNTGAFAPCTSPYSPGTLTNGAYTVEVRGTDAAGNFAQAQRSFTVDLTPPVVSITGGPTGPTNVPNPTFTFTATGATTVQCRMGTGAYSTCSGSYSPGTLANGTFTFEVRATDAATNFATATRTFTVDTVPPGVTITSGPTGPTNNTSPTFGFTTSGGATATTCRINTGAFMPCTSPYSPGPLSNGAFTVEVRAVDAAGNPASATRSFSVDTVPPTVSITGGPTSTPMAQETFTFTASAGSTTFCRIYPAGSPSGAYVPCSSPYVANMPPPPVCCAANWVFEVIAYDPAGNPATATWAFSTYIIT